MAKLKHTFKTDILFKLLFTKYPELLKRLVVQLLWLALFKADTEEELKQIQVLEVPELNEAINAYHIVASSPEFQELERMRIKAKYDEAQALRNERRKEKIEIAKRLLDDGDSIDKVIKVTGLTYIEVEALRAAD